LITSVSPSGHRISTTQPDPGFFRATKVGRCSDIPRICACGGQVQASYPATIKLTHYRALADFKYGKTTDDPVTKGFSLVTSDGPKNFHGTREQLLRIGQELVKAAEGMPRPS
jgi:hypothetical protein